jgi:hypothetical protein
MKTQPFARYLLCLALTLPVLTGCDRVPNGLEPEKLVVFSAETLLGMPGTNMAIAVLADG